MRIRVLSLLLCCFFVISVLTACGSQSKEDVTADDQATTVEKSDEVKDTSKSQENAPKGNKKIAIVQESKDEIRDATEQKIVDALSKGGYVKGQNAEITEIQMQGDVKKSADVVKQIKDLKPDVVVINSSSNTYETVGKALDGSGIPVVVCVGVETIGAVDDSGKPTSNITGIYTMPKDLQNNAFNLLNKISPINNKKAVFITTPGFFKKEDVEKNLKPFNIELKDYVESKYLEDHQAAVNKYNADNDVGWILFGVAPGEKKDGTTGVQVQAITWYVANSKKPSVTYWEVGVQMGILCGLGVDLVEVGSQAGEMAVKILDGEKVENVTAQSPRKVNIALNQKTAKNLNIQFPADILGSASKVYDTTILDSK